MARPEGKKTTPTPIRLDEELLREVRQASDLTKLTDQGIIRLAIRIGLERLKRIKYDVAIAVYDASEQVIATPAPLSLAAEEPRQYQKKKIERPKS